MLCFILRENGKNNSKNKQFGQLYYETKKNNFQTKVVCTLT